mgnify:CR=1 FL=1
MKLRNYLIEEKANVVKKPHFTKDEAAEIGKKLGIDWEKSDFDVEQFRMGLDVELEHGKINEHTNVTDDDPIKTGKIALAHLNEIKNYYTLLDEMEKKGKKTENPVLESLFNTLEKKEDYIDGKIEKAAGRKRLMLRKQKTQIKKRKRELNGEEMTFDLPGR